LREVADSAGISIVAGAPLYSKSGVHIGAICFLPYREPIIYTKQYLHEGEETAFVAGRGGPPLSIHERTVCIAICAEIKHAQHPENAAAQGAEIYAASCFITPTGYVHDTSLLENYARSHRMTVVMANYGGACAEWDSAGASAIWSGDGRLMARAPSQGEAVITSRLELRAEQDLSPK
jgi:predicted amidohydrolase